jgi:hypothetical protein
MHILILGNATDAHAAHLHTALTQGGATVAYFDTRLFPTHLCLSWDPQTSQGPLRLPGLALWPCRTFTVFSGGP